MIRRISAKGKKLHYAEAYVLARISEKGIELGSVENLLLLAVDARDSQDEILKGTINSAAIALFGENGKILGIGSSISKRNSKQSRTPNAGHAERLALLEAMNRAGIKGDLDSSSSHQAIKQALNKAGIKIIRIFTERPPCYTSDRYPDGCTEFLDLIKPEGAKNEIYCIINQEANAITNAKLKKQLRIIKTLKEKPERLSTFKDPERINLFFKILERLHKTEDTSEIQRLERFVIVLIEAKVNLNKLRDNLDKVVKHSSSSASQSTQSLQSTDTPQQTMELSSQQNLFLQTAVDRYLQEMGSHGTEGTGAWGGDVELEAIADALEAKITIQGTSQTFGRGEQEITLQHNGTHYSAIIAGQMVEVYPDGDCMFRACLTCMHNLDNSSDITLEQINTLRENVTNQLRSKWAELDLHQKPPYIQYHALFQSVNRQQLLGNARELPAGELLFEAICLYYFNKIRLSANEADKNVLFAELCSIGTEGYNETFLTGLHHYLRERMGITEEGSLSTIATAELFIQTYSEKSSPSASKPEAATASSLGEHFAKVTGEFETQASSLPVDDIQKPPPLTPSATLPPSEPKNPGYDIKDSEKPGKKPKQNKRKQ